MTSAICMQFYLFSIYGMKAEKGREARKLKKVIIRMMILVFCHFHNVLPVFILFYGIENEIMRMMLPDVWHLHTVLHVTYLRDGGRGKKIRLARENNY
jgi:hypothetical protein